MKTITALLLSFVLIKPACAQSHEIDSITQLIATAKSDTAKINLMNSKNYVLTNINLDSSVALGKQIIMQAKKANYLRGEAVARRTLGVNYCFKGLYNDAKINITDAIKIFTYLKDTSGLAAANGNMGVYYGMQGIYDSSILFYKKAELFALQANDKERLSSVYMNLGISYQMTSDFAKSLIYFQKALKPAEQQNNIDNQAFIFVNLGITYNNMKDTIRAEQSFLKAINLAQKKGLKNVLIYSYSNLASIYLQHKNSKQAYTLAIKATNLANENGDAGMQASCLSKAGVALGNMNRFTEAEALINKAIPIAASANQPINIYQTNVDMGTVLDMQQKYKAAIPFYEKGFNALQHSDLYDQQVSNSYSDLAFCYEQTGDFKNALSAYKTYTQIKDSLQSRENIRRATELTLNYEFEKQQQVTKGEQQKKDAVSKTRQTALIAGLALTFILAAVAFNGFRNKRRSNVLLQNQKEEIQNTLKELRSTQAQLIQSEKMASLGELTAGIAHEIQNPLNFVNNFSEVNKELIEELKIKNEQLKIEDDEVNEMLNDISANEEKINHHGKRADAIVKGMLQHSRQTKGVKEPTDINALCDEYLRLSYHGLRAKDKNFNVDFKTDFDESIGKINIVPQDIGRVLLNLFNNAFYAVKPPNPLKEEQWKPLVSVTTKKIKLQNSNAAANSLRGLAALK